MGNDYPEQKPPHFFGLLRLDYATATRADISKQNFTVFPRCWYIDAVCRCYQCNEEFTFSADEQRFWYEDMQFWVESSPQRCVRCRKDQRALLKLQQRYDALIAAALGKSTFEKKKEVVQIVDELVAAGLLLPEKMKKNRARLYAQLKRSSLADASSLLTKLDLADTAE